MPSYLQILKLHIKKKKPSTLQLARIKIWSLHTRRDIILNFEDRYIETEKDSEDWHKKVERFVDYTCNLSSLKFPS